MQDSLEAARFARSALRISSLIERADGVANRRAYHPAPIVCTALLNQLLSPLWWRGSPDVKAEKTKRKAHPKRERERPLSEANILDAALRLIRKDGIDQLGMRGLAQELGVSTMAVYYYVPNKEELLHRVAEWVLAKVPTPPPSAAAWERQMREYARAIVELLSAYPGLSRVVLARRPQIASQRLTSYALSLLAVAGFDPRNALLCALSFHTHLLGVLTINAHVPRVASAKTTGKRATPRTPADTRRNAVFDQLIADDWIGFGIETSLTGIRARLQTVRRTTPLST